MISVQSLYLQFGDRVLFDDLQFTLREEGKYGLLGRNGSGKTTLLKVLTGEISPDQGTIDIPGDYTLGYLKQHFDLDPLLTVRENAALAFAEIKNTEASLATLNEELADRTDYESESYQTLIQKISDLTDKLTYLGSEDTDAEIELVLKGLGFSEITMDEPTEKLSGGWKMRVQLAQILLSKPSVLLLDEPTNHLDIDSIIWLEKFLKNYPGTVVLISHDRQFLDQVVTEVYELERGRIDYYHSNYSGYLEQKEARAAIQQAAYVNQQKMIAEKERTIERFRANANRASMAKSMERSLQKLERIEEVVSDAAPIKLTFPPVRRSAQVVSKIRNAGKSFGDNHVFGGVNMEILRGERIAFVGQNGQGKSTLTRIIVGEWEPSEGEVVMGGNVDLGYFAQNQVDFLPGNKTILEYMEDESPAEMRSQIRPILGAFLFEGDDVEKKIKVLSGGEKTRLAIARMLLDPINFLVLDEPTHHLDLQTKSILKNALEEYEGTLLVVSHDRDLLEGLTQKTYEFRDGEVKEYLGDVEYFLLKREEDNMRAIEARSASEPQKSKSRNEKSDPILSYAEKKALRNKVNSTERQISNIERKIDEYEVEMMEPDFYERKESGDILKEHQILQNKMEKLLNEWEQLSLQMEAQEG